MTRIRHATIAGGSTHWVLMLFSLLGVSQAFAQNQPGRSVQFRVTAPTQKLEMIANTSRILKLDHKVPRLMVDDPTIIRANPLSPDQIQISALKAGFTQLTVFDEEGGMRTVDILVMNDARELENLLASEFPDAVLRVRPTANSVIVSGQVSRPDMVHRVVSIVEDYYPKVHNNITVSGAQEVLLHVRVMEVSRSKLRKLGVDWANFNGDDGVIQNAAGLIGSYTLNGNAGSSVLSNRGESLAFGVVTNDNAFFGFIEALRRYNLVKVMSDPTLVTVSGRPASFNVGGEFPIIVPQSLGTVSIQYREFGTRIDFVPMVLGNGNIRLDVRPQVSEIDTSRGVTINNTTVPGLRTRWADTGVEMKAGQTLALAGLVQTQEEAENKGLPFLADMPWIGGLFRRVQIQHNEVELLILVTPEFADAMDPHEVPPCGPGQSTTAPNDGDFYYRGYLEVPNCCPDGSCSNCQAGNSTTTVVPASGSYPTPAGLNRIPPQPEAVSARESTNTVQRASAAVRDSQKNRYFRYGPSQQQRTGATKSSEGGPGFIGPVGYDVSK